MVVVADLVAKFSTQGDADVSAKMQSLGQQVDAVRTKTTEAAGRASGLTTALGGIATMALGAFAGGIGAASNFQFQMSAVQAVTGATTAQMRGLSSQALDLSKNSIFSAQQIGQAQEEIAKAGLSVNDMMAGATEATIQLAHATGGDLTSAATIAANALNQFGLSGSDAGHVADVLTNAANTSALDVSDLGESLKYAAPAAHALGIGIEDTTAALSVMADQGLRGSRAGTDLKDVLLALAGPTTSQIAGFTELGLSVNDMFGPDGTFIGMGPMIQKVADATKNLTDQKRLDYLTDAFGKQGAQAMVDLLNSQSDAATKAGKSWGDYVRNMNVAGSASKQAATRLDNFQGSLLKLKQTLTVLGIQLGSVLLGPMKAIVDAIRTMLNAFLSLPAGMQQTIAAVGLVAAAFFALRSGFGGILPILGQISPGFAKLGTSLAGLAPALLGVAAAAGVFYLAYRTNFLGIGDKTRQVMADASKGIDYFKSTFQAARDNGVDPFNASLAGLTGAAVGVFGPNSAMVHGAQTVQKLGRYFTDVFKSGNTLTKSLNALPQPLQKFAQGAGILVDTAHDFVRAWDQRGVLGVIKQFPAEVFDVSDAFARMIGQIPGFGPVGAALETGIRGVEGVFNNFVRDLQNVQNTFNELRTNGFGIIEAAVISLSDVFPTLSNAFSSLGDAATNFANAFHKVIDGFMAFFAEDYGTALKDFGQAAVAALSGIGDIALALGQAILDGIGAIDWGSVTDALRTGALDALNSLGQLAGWVLDVGAPTLFGWILQAASWLSDKILGTVKAVAPVLAGWLLNVAAPTLFGWTLEAASWLGGKILDAISSVAPKLEGWTLNVLAPTLGGWVLDAVGWLSGEIKKYLPTGLSALADFGGWLLNVLAPTVVGWVEDAFDWLYGYISAKLPATGTKLADLVGWTINTGAPDLTGWVEDAGTNLYNAFQPKIANVDWSGIASSVDEGLAGAVNSVQWQQLGESGGQLFVAGVALGILGLVSGAGAVLTSASFAAGLAAAAELGKGLLQGITQPVKDLEAKLDFHGITIQGPQFGPLYEDIKNAIQGFNDLRQAIQSIRTVSNGLKLPSFGIAGLGSIFAIRDAYRSLGQSLDELKQSMRTTNFEKLAIPGLGPILTSVLAIRDAYNQAHDAVKAFLDVFGGSGTQDKQATGAAPGAGAAGPGNTGGVSSGGGVGGFGAGGGFAGEGGMPFMGTLGSAAGGLSDLLVPDLSGLKEKIQQAIQPPDFSAFIAAFQAAGQQAADALGAGLQTALTAVTAVVSAIGIIAGGLVGTLTGQGTAAGSGWAIALGVGLQTGLSAVVAVFAAIRGQATSLSGALGATGSSGGQSWAVGLGAGLQTGLSATAAVAGAIRGQLSSLAGAAGSYGSQAGYSFAYGLGSGLQSALSAASAVAGAIESILGGLDLYGAGANASESFAAGLWAGVPSAEAAASALAAAAFQATLATLSIGSPSKKFRWAGDMSVDGFLEPLQQRRPEVMDAMTTLMTPPRPSSSSDALLLQTLSRSQQQSSQPQIVDNRTFLMLSREEFQRWVSTVDGFHVLTDPGEMKAITVKAR